MSGPLFYQNAGTLTQFNGELIAHVSSQLPSKERWTEFDIFISEHDEWILQGQGKSRVPGEQDRMWAVISRDPSDLLQAILGNECSRLAKRLISETFTSLAGINDDEEAE